MKLKKQTGNPQISQISQIFASRLKKPAVGDN